ncbi:MAG: hypothetical protein JWP82_2148 [Humibacillus sp.]|nr:hypothetical protein [Humibacillus sp.]
MPPSPTVRQPGDATATYRYLRGAMVALLLALLLSVVLQWWVGTDRSCWLGSISAYYFTPARTVFVGTLVGLGITLVVYQGHSPEENVLLDFSGFMALLVAAVPTVPDLRCGVDPHPDTTAELAAGIAVTLPTLAAVTALVLATLAVLRVRGRAAGGPPATRAVAVIRSVCAVLVAVELVLVAVLRGPLVPVAHGVAATLLVLGAVAVMVSSALRVEERHGLTPAEQRTAAAYRRTYLALAVTLGVLLALIVAAHLLVAGFGLAVLLAEVAVLLLFGAYWVVQTVELWSLGDETHPEARHLDHAVTRSPP